MKTVDLERFLRTGGAPPITLISPAFNEEATLVESVRSLLSLNYPEFEVLVSNDGSTDGTMETLTNAFNLEPVDRVPMGEIPTASVRGTYRSRRYPNLWVLDKENGGKADALNAGINYCRSALFCAMDADTILERDSLLRIVRPFLEDSRTIAAGGIIRIANGCTINKGQVEEGGAAPEPSGPGFQVMEYLRAFLAVRMGWDALGSTLIVSGAFGIFDRALVVEVGGFSTTTVGEDMELIVRLHRYCREHGRPYKIEFVPDPVAWTECPETLAVLGRQRDRWQRGLLESLIRHRTMLFNPRYGRLGLVAYPYFFFLEMIGPVVETLGYVSFLLTLAAGRASVAYVLAFLAVAFAFGMVLSISAVCLEEVTFRRYPERRDLLSLFLIAVLENFGYRQLNTFWRLKGTISGVMGRGGWGVMTRKGFDSSAA